jgi:DNA-binding LacI/PurR family transcriptional regulator
VAIIGYDNLDLATVIDPALTTIDQQHAEYAAAAVRMLQHLAEPGTIDPTERMAVIKPRLIVRASTASPAR